MTNFSTRLKILRSDGELSQQALADILKISKSSINMYERGEREPNFETLEAIADYFNVDLDYLMGRQDKQRKFDFDYLKLNHDIQLTTHEHKVINAYRNQPEMQPAVDRLLGVDSNDIHLMPVAAHNDTVQSKEEQTLIQEDLDEL